MNEHITRRLRFENSSGIIYDRDSDDTMYESVVHTPNEAELHHMTMTCPNCGAVNPVAALTQGCPYCSTVFQIKDLFPRVTNTYFIRNNASMKNVNKRGSTIWITMLVVFLFTFISIYFYFLSFRPGESDSCQPDHVLFCHTDLRRHHRTYAFIRSFDH